jgi:hypothetical protein
VKDTRIDNLAIVGEELGGKLTIRERRQTSRAGRFFTVWKRALLPTGFDQAMLNSSCADASLQAHHYACCGSEAAILR